jgi:hypothetical protein
MRFQVAAVEAGLNQKPDRHHARRRFRHAKKMRHSSFSHSLKPLHGCQEEPCHRTSLTRHFININARTVFWLLQVGFYQRCSSKLTSVPASRNAPCRETNPRFRHLKSLRQAFINLRSICYYSPDISL